MLLQSGLPFLVCDYCSTELHDSGKQGKDQTSQNKALSFCVAAVYFHSYKDQLSYLWPTILSSLIKLKEKKKKKKPGCPPIPHHPFIYPTNSSPQQPDPKHICIHIPLEWRANFLEINWVHAEIHHSCNFQRSFIWSEGPDMTGLSGSGSEPLGPEATYQISI